MHLWYSVRRHSRNNNTASSKRTAGTTSMPSLPASPTASTARQPLGPQTNLNFSSSQSSIAPEESAAGSSTHSSQKSQFGTGDEQEGAISKPVSDTKTGRSERSNTVSSVRDRSSPGISMAGQSSSQRSPYSSHPDLYTRNALHSFSFGAATSTSSSSPSIDPLSPRDDGDSEEYGFKADTTPRPSLAGPSTQYVPGALPMSLPPPPRRTKMSPQRRRRNSNASTNTFGTSSASASATSLSSNPHGGSATTPHTSSHEFTSDDEAEHRHPLPIHFNSPHDRDGYRYASDGDDDDEEEFDDDYYDRNSEPDIDISPEIHEDADRFTVFNNASRDSFRSAFQRKGSLAVPIPSPSVYDGRDREDSISTLRRPSRSLENLKSDSLRQVHYNASREIRPAPQAPTSMPESDVDWRDLRRRSLQKEQDRAKMPPSATTSRLSLNQTGLLPVQTSALEGFDASWTINPTVGIIDLDWDQSELADIVGGFRGPRSSDRSFRRGSSSTTDSGRRLSTTSTNSDPFTRGLNKWGGQQYADERMKWTFCREKADRLEENRPPNERERSSISSLFNPRSSSSASSMIGSSAGLDQIAPFRERERNRGKEKEKNKEPAVWKGMAIEAEEWWSSYSNGRYKVTRTSLTSHEPGKPPQQRLNITHHRTPYSFKRDHSDGPTVTIHKHSKAVGFSISRHYRSKPPSGSAVYGRSSTSSRSTVPLTAPIDKKKPSSMILLAARRVQEAYTSTTTTRKLESHGLLNESGRQSSRDKERLDRFEREKKKEAEKEKQRLEEVKKQEARKNKEKGKGKSSQASQGEAKMASSSESSTGSVNDHSTSSNSSSSKHLSPPPRTNRPSVDYSIVSHETNSSDRTIVWNRRSSEDIDYDDDDDDGVMRKAPTRTPHPETYATLPAEAFESYASQQESHSSSIFSWSKHRGHSVLQRHIQQSYNPPWAIAQARFHPDRKGIVEDLNTSFQDVGLLPAVDEVKGSALPHKRKRYPPSDSKSSSRASSTIETPNVFHSFSSDYLYMLLPLWPSETDPSSAQKYPFSVPFIPVESRQYILIYYKPDDVPPPEADKNKGAKEPKKRSRPSPTSSRDSVTKQGEKYTLYEKFHFCARIVSYSDLQGSGVRSPDGGLSILGPLEEAYETRPQRALIDTFQVVGVCSSREKGIEFVPEGLEKLGLTRRVPDPNAHKEEEVSGHLSIRSIEEQDEPSDSMLVLTPIGRAVVEMAWLGAMALTSFGPGT